MIIRFFFLLFNVCILYSNAFDYYKLDVDYLNLSQKIFAGKSNFSSKNNINFDNEIFVKLQDKGEDDFLNNNIQENETLNVEKTIESNWGKRAFRFSAISVGTFPIALLVSLFFFLICLIILIMAWIQNISHILSQVVLSFPKMKLLKIYDISISWVGNVFNDCF